MSFAQTIAKIKAHNPQLGKTIEDRGGFLTQEDLPKLEAIDRMMLLLVRCNCGRFLTPAQNVKHFVDLITDHANRVQAETGMLVNANSDYVRDVSIPS